MMNNYCVLVYTVVLVHVGETRKSREKQIKIKHTEMYVCMCAHTQSWKRMAYARECKTEQNTREQVYYKKKTPTEYTATSEKHKQSMRTYIHTYVHESICI